jgi:hypothetical protein
MLFTLFLLVCIRFAQRRQALELGSLFRPLGVFMLCIVAGVVHGLATGGNARIIVVEMRPFEYLLLAYLVSYNLVSRIEHVRNFLWIVILGAGIKGAQGVYIVVVYLHGHTAGQNEIMAHEESFFWVGVILLVVLFCLHYNYKPQLIAALCIMPPLVVALVANNRRTGYVDLVIGVAVAWVIIVVVRKQGRAKRLVALVICGALAAAYVFVFSHASGTLAEPARAIMSTISPSKGDARDTLSNLYRIYENFDLKYTEKQSLLLGYGFGKPFLQPYILPNILAGDPYYLYVPHNNIYWLWMRLGPIGFSAFWYFIASIIITACGIARRLRNPYLQLVAIYVVSITFMEVLASYADYQLFFYRNVMYLGILLGILLRMPAMEKPPQADPALALSTEQPARQPSTASAAEEGRPRKAITIQVYPAPSVVPVASGAGRTPTGMPAAQTAQHAGDSVHSAFGVVPGD